MPQVYRFDDVELNLRDFRVLKAGKVVSLEPKALNVLAFLAENRGRLVEKRELLDAVWGEAFVTENVLTRAIAQLRKALEDGAKETRYIETVPTRGYRFIADVSVEEIAGTRPNRQSDRSRTLKPDSEGAEELIAAEPPSVTPRPPSSRYRRLLAVAAIVIAAAIGVAWGLWRQPGRTSDEPLGFASNQQFSSGAGLDINACFSPDGNLVAYASDRSGSFEIYIRSLENGARELQLTNNGNQNMYPTFSPDGRSVAFSSAKSPGIFRVAAIGGPMQRLTDFGVQPAWSPDGSSIVFRSGASASLSTTDYYYNSDSSLWLVPAEGGTPRQITNRDSPAGGQNFPSWSPDGQEIRFINYLGAKISLWTYRLRDGALQKRFERQVSNTRGTTTFGSATFSRDGSRMYFVTSQLNGNIGISELRLNPDTFESETTDRLLYSPSVGVPRDLSLSPDGKHLAYSAIVSESRIMVMGMAGDASDGSEPIPLTHEVLYRSMLPSWSPDSQSVTFVQFRKSSTAQAYVARLDGTPAIQVRPNAAIQNYPQFLADGKTVAYVELGPSGRFIKATALGDGTTRTLAELPVNIRPDGLSPDGSEFSYSDTSGNVMHLWKQDLRSGVRTQLTFGPDSTGYGQYSRDGKWLELEVDRGQLNIIGVMPSSGGKITEIWTQPGQWFAKNWSPDDSKILMAGDPGGGWAIYWVSRDGGSSKQVTKTLPMRMYVRYPDWSPDGKKIAYEFNESKGNVYVAELK